jgi:hypothetical protein
LVDQIVVSIDIAIALGIFGGTPVETHNGQKMSDNKERRLNQVLQIGELEKSVPPCIWQRITTIKTVTTSTNPNVFFPGPRIKPRMKRSGTWRSRLSGT